MRCRTAALGGHLRACDHCGRLQIAYNSCNHRNCPKCGGFEKAQWLSEQAMRLLPVPHFHGVFTVDHLVNPLAYVNPAEIYDLLFRTANRVLKPFAAKYLGGAIGITAVLHTWGQILQQHIHLHCMITGGALVETADGYVWRSSAAGFLLPVVELSAAFRDAFCKGLRRLHRQKKLRLVGECAEMDVEALVQQMQSKKWEVYLGAPPEHAQLNHLLGYLGRYVHRTAITNQRLRNIEEGQVTFEYYNNRERDAEGQGAKRVMTLPAIEFIRRFLQHVLPFQYKRVRHFGLYASGNKLWRQAVRLLLGKNFEPVKAPRLQRGDWLQGLGVEDAFLGCPLGPFCQQGQLRLRHDFAPLRGWVFWLLFLLGVQVFGKEASRCRLPRGRPHRGKGGVYPLAIFRLDWPALGFIGVRCSPLSGGNPTIVPLARPALIDPSPAKSWRTFHSRFPSNIQWSRRHPRTNWGRASLRLGCRCSF